MAELADAPGLGPGGATRAGSNPALGTSEPYGERSDEGASQLLGSRRDLKAAAMSRGAERRSDGRGGAASTYEQDELMTRSQIFARPTAVGRSGGPPSAQQIFASLKFAVISN